VCGAGTTAGKAVIFGVEERGTPGRTAVARARPDDAARGVVTFFLPVLPVSFVAFGTPALGAPFVGAVGASTAASVSFAPWVVSGRLAAFFRGETRLRTAFPG
jgi:hypothetical protein